MENLTKQKNAFRSILAGEPESTKPKEKTMVKYLGSSKQQPKAFSDQKWFDDFNWQHFVPGDLVWLEDYTERVTIIAGVFLRIESDGAVVVRLIPNKDGEILARNNSESLIGYSDYWQRYLKG